MVYNHDSCLNVLIFLCRAGFKPSSNSSEPPSNANRPTAASLIADYDSSEESGSDRSESEDESPVKRREGKDSDEEEARERDQVRRDLQKKRQRELRMSNMGTEAKARHLAR